MFYYERGTPVVPKSQHPGNICAATRWRHPGSLFSWFRVDGIANPWTRIEVADLPPSGLEVTTRSGDGGAAHEILGPVESLISTSPRIRETPRCAWPGVAHGRFRFRISVLRFRARGGVRVYVQGLRVEVLGLRIQGLALRVSVKVFDPRVWGVGCMVQGAWFTIHDL